MTAPQTPPKDLDVSLILTIIDDAILENIGAEQARDEIVELVTAWSDRRTLAIIGDDENEMVQVEGSDEPARDYETSLRNNLRTEQRKALEADGGGYAE